MVIFEKDRLIIKPIIKAAFWKKKKIPYNRIKKIEADGENVIFHMTGDKVIKAADPAIVAFYPEFGDMLRDNHIPFKMTFDDKGYESIETVREKAAFVKQTALDYANKLISEKLTDAYELKADIKERIIGTTLEFDLYKDGISVNEAKLTDTIENIPVVDEMDIAYLNEWDPDLNTGTYYITEEAYDRDACERYVKTCILDELFNLFIK